MVGPSRVWFSSGATNLGRERVRVKTQVNRKDLSSPEVFAIWLLLTMCFSGPFSAIDFKARFLSNAIETAVKISPLT
jgi:hypothetical protein